MTFIHPSQIKSHGFIDIQAWLKEGLLLQTDKQILLGEGPMTSSDKPSQGFFHSDFFLEKKNPWLFPKKISSTTRVSLEKWLNDAIRSNELNPINEKKGGRYKNDSKRHPLFHKTTEQPSFMEFHTVFSQLQQKIKQGVLKKGVPVFFEKRDGKVCVLNLLKTLLQKTSSISHKGFLYGIWNAKGGILGFTPETLFSFSGKDISLMALAGTAPWPGSSLFHDPKETQEHQWVIQSLKNALKHTVTWNTSYTKEKKFGSLKHLCTTIEGNLKMSADFTFLCRKLHPTAALGGFPKQAALQWLRENPQQKNRGYFGAPFGFFDGKNKGFCLIALRGMEWDSQGIRIGAGCGLIESSVLQKEWRELTLKRNQIKQFFQIRSKL